MSALGPKETKEHWPFKVIDKGGKPVIQVEYRGEEKQFVSFHEIPLFLWDLLNLGIAELSANQSLGVEDSVVRVHGDLVLSGITDKSLRVVESDVGRGGSVSLVVGA
jgi:hypothetical protein